MHVHIFILLNFEVFYDGFSQTGSNGIWAVIQTTTFCANVPLDCCTEAKTEEQTRLIFPSLEKKNQGDTFH